MVRATGSGAGCGQHWPLCNGEIIPLESSKETLIELTHRITSGLYGIYVLALAFWTFHFIPKGGMARKAAIATVFFTLVEALIGARLVLLGLVAEDASVERAFVIAFHLTNTIFLVTSIVFWIHGSKIKGLQKRDISQSLKAAFLICSVLFILTAVSGAITALGDTLFPASSLTEGLSQKWVPGSHFLIQLRVFHPFLAVTLVGGFFVFSKIYGASIKKMLGSSFLVQLLVALAFGGLAFGLINLLLLAPVWSQLVHLLWANVIWTVFVLIFVHLRYPASFSQLLEKK